VLDPEPPGISGPAALTLTEGYEATSTDAFSVTGNPEPTMSKASGNAAITFNGDTMKLDIAAGLAPGTYPVTLKASNGREPDATITFTLTVKAASVDGDGDDGSSVITPGAQKPAPPQSGQLPKTGDSSSLAPLLLVGSLVLFTLVGRTVLACRGRELVVKE